MRIRIALVVAACAATTAIAQEAGPGAPARVVPVPHIPRSGHVRLLDFEDGVLPRPTRRGYGLEFFVGNKYNRGKYAWAIDDAVGANGSKRSLRLDVQEGQFYVYFLSDDRKAYVPGGRGANRMSFWLKLPAGWGQAGRARENLNVGTYLRDPRVWKGEPESKNNHHYFQLYLVPDGEWLRVVVGEMPHHQRSVHGLDPARTSWRPDIASFYETLTRFYVTGVPNDKPGFSPAPAPYKAWLDEVELYHEDERVVAHPEYAVRSGSPGDLVAHPMRIVNTHPSETRRFAVRATSKGAKGWARGALVDGDGRPVLDTGPLAPGASFDLRLLERIPEAATGTADRRVTSVLAWQVEPAVPPSDPRVLNRSIFAERGDAATPSCGALFVTEIGAPGPVPVPGPVPDLSVRRLGPSLAELAWTAPAGAAAYDVRVSLSPIADDEAFDRAMPLASEPVPSAAGAREVMLVPGLRADLAYFFAVRAESVEGRRSRASPAVSLPPEGGKS